MGKNINQTVGRLSSLILGLVLLGSGVLKLQDPSGAGLVMEEYLNFLHLGFLGGASQVLGTAFAFAESVIGAALVCGVWTFITWISSGVLMILFTILTLLLLIFNPAMDCGCFGEAVKLTHLQSFVKNIVLDILWALCYRNVGFCGLTGLCGKLSARAMRYVVFAFAALMIVFFMLSSFYRLPLMDFTNLSTGTELFGYDNPDGPVLSIYDVENEEYIEDWEGSALVFSSYEALSDSQRRRVNDFVMRAISNPPLNDNAPSQIFFVSVEATKSAIPYGLNCTSDRRTILALNRSNGGLSYIRDGQVVAKWHNRNLDEAFKYDDVDSLLHEQIASGRMHFTVFSVVLLLLILI